jgi:hypothetical protein
VALSIGPQPLVLDADALNAGRCRMDWRNRAGREF